MTDASLETPEFSRPISVDDIDAEDVAVELEATAAERRRLADRFGLLEIGALTARLTVSRGSSGIPIRVFGRFRAALTQCCGVSLDPFDSVVENSVEVEFVPAVDVPIVEEFDIDDADPPEPLQGSEIDLGELVAQHLAVSLDPYPRKSGAEAPTWDGSADSTDDNPFAVLEKLRKNRDESG